MQETGMPDSSIQVGAKKGPTHHDLDTMYKEAKQGSNKSSF